MGSNFELTVLASNEDQANNYIEMAVAEIIRIEQLVSSWDPKSQTSSINKNAGIKPVKVSQELLSLIQTCRSFSQLTDGAFDISYASLDLIWKFDGSMKEMPTEEAIKKSIELVGFEHIVLDEENLTVYLPKKGMKIGFGAIGKGYAADKARTLLKENGAIAGIINASGDMTVWGKQSNGEDWKVAITNPLNKEESFARLPVKSGAVVTSGNYEKFVVFNGVSYSHIIDPRTGYPTRGIASVTVFANNAEIADALATAVFVMGVETGLDRINQMAEIECIIIDDTGKIWKSKNIRINENE